MLKETDRKKVRRERVRHRTTRENGAIMNPWVTTDGCNYQMDGFKSSLIDVISSMSDY